MTEEMDVEDTALNTARDFALEKIRGWCKGRVSNVVDNHKTPEAALRWFCAYRQACQLLEMNTAKDWAGILIDGYKPMGFRAELESFYDYFDGEELSEGWQEELLEVLEQHFGISKG